MLATGARSLSSAVGGTVLVLFFVLLMLAEAAAWRQKLEASSVAPYAATVLDVASTVSTQVRRYLVARTVLGLVTAAAQCLWLWALHVELAAIWALLFFLFNYVPTVGSVIAAIPPALAALVTLGPMRAALAIAGMFVIEQVMGNVVDPKLVGRRLALSPLVVLVAVVFWGWVWGAAGALLAAPVTAAIVVTFAHVRALRPIALLLSDATSVEGLIRRTSDVDVDC